MAFLVIGSHCCGDSGAAIPGLGSEMIGHGVREGNDYWFSTFHTNTVDGVKTRGVLLSKRVGHFSGGKETRNWFVPHEELRKRFVWTVAAKEL